jgi:hypothetical protein
VEICPGHRIAPPISVINAGRILPWDSDSALVLHCTGESAMSSVVRSRRGALAALSGPVDSFADPASLCE